MRRRLKKVYLQKLHGFKEEWLKIIKASTRLKKKSNCKICMWLAEEKEGEEDLKRCNCKICVDSKHIAMWLE